MDYINGGKGHVRLRAKTTTIGKDSSCDIIIKGLTIGKVAATIKRTRDGYIFRYVEGMAKPRINDRRVTDEAVVLTESDIIKIGSTKLQFVIKTNRKKNN